MNSSIIQASLKTPVKPRVINLVWWNDPSSLFETKWIISLLSGFELNHIVDLEGQPCVENTIIIANLTHILCSGEGNFRFLQNHRRYLKEVQRFHDYIKRYQNTGIKVGLFHLGDEFWRESTFFYRNVDFVFRHHHKEEDHKRYRNCYYLPLGCKAGFSERVIDRPINQREYLWSFAGQIKGSRNDMIKHAKNLPGGFYYDTKQFNDPKGLSTDDYAALLCNTQFSLCPAGNTAVECFRLYESLEAGAIPIVEARNLVQSIATLFNPKLFIRDGSRDLRFWLRNYQYWQRAFPSGFPCPLIYRWRDLEKLIYSIDVESTSEKIRLWWQEYKQSFAQLIQATIEDTFFSS